MLRLMLLDPLQPPEAVVLDDLEDEVGMRVVVVGAVVLVFVVVVRRNLQQLLKPEQTICEHCDCIYSIVAAQYPFLVRSLSPRE